MSEVGIVTDSTNCLPPELIKEYGIRVVPVGIVINGKPYRDQIDITPAEFWRIFKDLKEPPSTSAANPQDFVDTFTELGKVTDNIVCILLPKALSATHESAVQAMKIVTEENPRLKIEIIDSKTAAGALGFIVLEAARAAKAGKSLAKVIEVAHNMIPRVKFVAALDTLKYLMKTGRAPKVAGFIGNMMQVKPIIGIVSGTGKVDALGRARGKQKCLLRLVATAKKHLDIKKPLHLMVHYSDNPEEADRLREIITAELNCVEVYTTAYTPVMSCAAGPQVALSFYSD